MILAKLNESEIYNFGSSPDLGKVFFMFKHKKLQFPTLLIHQELRFKDSEYQIQ